MQTLYYTTSNFIRYTDNVVDLSEYRRKLALAQQEPAWQEEEEAPQPRAVSPRPRTAHRRGLTLDACASMGILVMTLSFTMRVLFL